MTDSLNKYRYSFNYSFLIGELENDIKNKRLKATDKVTMVKRTEAVFDIFPYYKYYTDSDIKDMYLPIERTYTKDEVMAATREKLLKSRNLPEFLNMSDDEFEIIIEKKFLSIWEELENTWDEQERIQKETTLLFEEEKKNSDYMTVSEALSYLNDCNKL